MGRRLKAANSVRTPRQHCRWSPPPTAWSGSRNASSSNWRRTGQTFITPTAKHPPRKRCQALNRVGS